ncbi:hypothetical protein PILCRDRAFT_81931 [Piloderma croceum F 1598]|uniref:Carboxypeptidase n=1 Tax=Piloderma croceum (strain F 1598) TaxID=765440 RepID=A0A0C3EX77_PILCF|nr:hypothetical protein PILCRDRAFT_81931 [Piloderma croceum F 1598]
MLLNALVGILATQLASGVFGGQIPTVNGVLGGVPSDPATRSITDISLRAASARTPGKLRITENSGICETTAGVYQAAGYGDLTSSESIWYVFWFFAARKNPDTAPLVIWLNGGPGSSSMLGLFQEHGPCRITNDSSSVTPNKYSWNNNVNIMYIDQPVGAGFSYGDETVGTSEEAASDLWKFMQIFLKDSRFQKYANRSLGIWGESYGGHYGYFRHFHSYFLQQNTAISNGSVQGVPMNLKYMGVGDGLTDPITQYPGFLTYAASNPYHPLVNSSEINKANKLYTKSGGCKDQITACNNGGSNAVCSAAQNYCNNDILEPLAGNYDVYYVLATNPDPYPPNITNYLNSIRTKIGAAVPWQESNDDIYNHFAQTGDWMRTSKPLLETVIDAGVRTLIYDGDADYILNFNGVEAMVDSLQTKFSTQYSQQSFANYTVNGTKAGLFKNAGTFSYVRIFGAGHEVPAYKYGNLDYGQAAAQFFSQIMSNSSLSST